jgi:hypothetical protein
MFWMVGEVEMFFCISQLTCPNLTHTKADTPTPGTQASTAKYETWAGRRRGQDQVIGQPEMVRCTRCFLHRSMRVVNLIVNICGIGMIIYSLWLLKKWQDGIAQLPAPLSSLPRPWYFIYLFLICFLLHIYIYIYISQTKIIYSCLWSGLYTHV